jgi:hypothetical protein
MLFSAPLDTPEPITLTILTMLLAATQIDSPTKAPSTGGF